MSPILIFGIAFRHLAADHDRRFCRQLSCCSSYPRCPGVAQVFIGGESKPAIHVQVDPAKLAASGLTLEEIRVALVASTTNAAKGTLNTPDNSFTIASNDQLTLPEQYENVVLAYRNGAPIRVRDVGQSVLAPADRTVAAFTNHDRGLALLVTKQPGANVIETVDKIKAMLPQLTANLPART